MKLKICGMNNQENCNAIGELQPDFLGFIFWKQSKRYCENEIHVNSKSIEKVGVFVDDDFDTIRDTIQLHQLSMVQLHGKERPDFCLQIKSLKTKVIKAITVDKKLNFSDLNNYKNSIDYYLFDTRGKLPGGNGTTFDWEILNQYKENIPYFLSGGIGLNELPKLEKFLQSDAAKYCFAIDINSRFEDEPGIKNKEKIKEFQEKLKQLR